MEQAAMDRLEVNPAAGASEEAVKVFEPAPVVRGEHTEASLTRALEQQSAKIPSHWFLAASLATMAASAGFELVGKRRWSRFVGMWAPSLLVMGVYNKLVKSLGPR
ncbi:MAG: hypothetical protein WEB88_04365 [Gemmatimonadota bacterium]